MTNVAIYKLRNPLDGYKAYYIGQTRSPRARLWEHICCHAPSEMTVSILESSNVPRMDIVKFVPEKDALEHEGRMIHAHVIAGFALENRKRNLFPVDHIDDAILQFDIEVTGLYINIASVLEVEQQQLINRCRAATTAKGQKKAIRLLHTNMRKLQWIFLGGYKRFPSIKNVQISFDEIRQQHSIEPIASK